MPSSQSEQLNPQEEPPSSRPAAESVQEDRLDMKILLDGLYGEEYDRNIALLTAMTPEGKRSFFEGAEEEQLEKLAALCPLSANALRQLLDQPHPTGFHSRGEVLAYLAQLHELTGDEKFIQVCREYADKLPAH